MKNIILPLNYFFIKFKHEYFKNNQKLIFYFIDSFKIKEVVSYISSCIL